MTLWLGKLEVRIMQLGRGHTKGDTVVWLPEEKVLFSGDLVEFGATPYAGDAYFQDWPETLRRIAALRPEKRVPGRGDALVAREDCERAIDGTRAFVTALYGEVKRGVAERRALQEGFGTTPRAPRPRRGARGA